MKIALHIGHVMTGASITCSTCNEAPNVPATTRAYSRAASEGALKSVGTRTRENMTASLAGVA